MERFDAGSLGSVSELLRLRADQQPDGHAFTFLKDGVVEADRLTYAELLGRAAGVAAGLHERGLSGGAALLLYPAGIEFVVAFYACMLAKVVAIPAVPPSLKHHLVNLDAIMADAGTDLILTCERGLDRLRPPYEGHQAPRRHRQLLDCRPQ